ncbi:MAG: hypothetical protein ACJASX_004349 [Limisphaerales bacterium]|jgi:hypothetical protein
MQSAVGIISFFGVHDDFDAGPKIVQIQSVMDTCTVSEAKGKLGKLADRAIEGEPTVIVRGGKLVILQAYELPDHPDEFDSLIQAGKAGKHRALTPKVLREIWSRGRSLAK